MFHCLHGFRDLTENFWSCDCFLRWLGEYLGMNPSVLSMDAQTVCLWPPRHINQPISSVAVTEFQCCKLTSWKWLDLSIASFPGHFCYLNGLGTRLSPHPPNSHTQKYSIPPPPTHTHTHIYTSLSCSHSAARALRHNYPL